MSQAQTITRSVAMSVKFLHTSDWQMGMRALGAGAKAKEVRAVRYETAAKIADLAKNEKVDFVILAGDLFESSDIDDLVVRRTVQALNAFAPTPVYVLPGNHDPLVAGGVWTRQSWKRVGDHVRLLTSAVEVAHSSDVTLYPSPLTQKQSTLDPTGWMPPRATEDRRIRIGVAHGSLDILPQKGNFPIAQDRVNQAGLDYLALGDWHGFARHGRAAYSGTPEQTSFGEQSSGDVVLVEIGGPGQEPRTSRRRVGSFNWTTHEPLVRDMTDVESLRHVIESTGPLEKQLIKVSLTLEANAPEVLSELLALREQLAEEAMSLDWSDESITRAMDEAVSLPGGILMNVESDLTAILDKRIPEGPGGRFANEDAQTVREATSLLRRLASEASK